MFPATTTPSIQHKHPHVSQEEKTSLQDPEIRNIPAPKDTVIERKHIAKEMFLNGLIMASQTFGILSLKVR